MADGPLSLWYRQPAMRWVEALPVGNGSLGAMVFGGSAREQIQFNEETVWTGHPRDYQHPGAVESLPEIRRLLAEGKQPEAEALAMREFMSAPLRQMAYQPLGDIRLHFPGHDRTANYRRALDLDQALASVRYTVEGVTHARLVFSSYPDQVLVIHLAADRPRQVGFRVTIDSPHASAVTRIGSGDQVVLTGQVEEGGVRFEASLRVRTEGGTVTTEARELVVAGADSATLLLAAASSFKTYRDHGADPATRCAAHLRAVGEKAFETLR